MGLNICHVWGYEYLDEPARRRAGRSTVYSTIRAVFLFCSVLVMLVEDEDEDE